MQSIQINYYSYTGREKEEGSSLYGGCKLLLSKDGFEVVRIDYGIASTSLFGIDVLLFSKSIQFGVKITRTESDDKIKLREILRPLHLPLDKYLSSGKILEVFMVCDNIDRIGQTFWVVSPNFKEFKNSKQFLIIYVIVQLHHGKSARVKGNWMDFIFFINNRKNYSESIVQSISFYNELSIGNSMSENRNRGEYLLERVESITTEKVKIPGNVLLDEACQWNSR